jgi:hypothetical protein
LLQYYHYDFEYKGKIIEYHGDYWHCNPEKYEETFVNKHSKYTAKEIWKRDEEKEKTAKEQ